MHIQYFMIIRDLREVQRGADRVGVNFYEQVCAADLLPQGTVLLTAEEPHPTGGNSRRAWREARTTLGRGTLSRPRAALRSRAARASTAQLRVTSRRPNVIDSILGNSHSGVWYAKRSCYAPAKNADTARDRNGVSKAGRDRNHPLTVEGIHAPWRMLIRHVTARAAHPVRRPT
jgi:hypothetical protein